MQEEYLFNSIKIARKQNNIQLLIGRLIDILFVMLRRDKVGVKISANGGCESVHFTWILLQVRFVVSVMMQYVIASCFVMSSPVALAVNKHGARQASEDKPNYTQFAYSLDPLGLSTLAEDGQAFLWQCHCLSCSNCTITSHNCTLNKGILFCW